MSQVWSMLLIKSTNICYASDRIAFTIKMNVKKTFMVNDSFTSFYMVNGLQSENKRPIYCLVKEGRIPATYSLPWVTLTPLISKVDIIKFCNPS